jgi:hypothetical protein
VSEVDDTTKSDVTIVEAKGGCSRLEVKDDQRKLGQWAKLLTRPVKKYG